MTTDVLSGILGDVRMNAAIYFDGEFAAPWGIDFPDNSKFAPYLSPGWDCVVSFHLFLEGDCFIEVEKGSVVALKPGDLVLMAQGHAHKMWSGAPATFSDALKGMKRHINGELRTLRFGSGDDITRVVCGYLGCDKHAAEQFLSGLPPLIVVNVRSDESGRWIESSLRNLVADAASGRAGGGALLSRMAEALFVECLRRWIDGLPEQHTGWLAGTRDPVVGRALALIHAEPCYAWTVDDLARRAGASRSALAERFGVLVGETPLAYLFKVRMRAAAGLLEGTRKTIVQVAADVGYESEASFNRAFKRQYGEPPARYRRRALATRGQAAPTQPV